MDELLWLIKDLESSEDAIVTESNDSYDENGTRYIVLLRDSFGYDKDGNDMEREYEEPELISEFLTIAYGTTCVWNYDIDGGKNLYYDGFYITLRFSSEVY